LADAVVNLKRAIGIRTKHLEELYRFKLLFGDIEGALERLEVIGLVRPFLLRQLMSLRDDIEHRDADPPSPARCRELSDATWYFLRSTDIAAKTVPDGVQLNPPGGGPKSDGNGPFFEVTTKGANPEWFGVRGWIPDSLMSAREEPLWLQLKVEPLRSKDSFPRLKELLNASQRGEPIDLHKFADADGIEAIRNLARSDQEKYIVGFWMPSQDHRRTICKLMLESL